MTRLCFAQGQRIPAKTKLDRIPQRRPTQDFDGCPVAEAHFQQPAANFGGSADFHHFAAATDAEFVERAGGRGADVRASSKITSLFHETHLTATEGVASVYTSGWYSS